jgi:hypothetical protein
VGPETGRREHGFEVAQRLSALGFDRFAGERARRRVKRDLPGNENEGSGVNGLAVGADGLRRVLAL